uniref:Uncharacterized protein n=1 Tax=Trichogramma kaykai TaxID=54128 RepID=A0ABD2VVW0_9HYME
MVLQARAATEPEQRLLVAGSFHRSGLNGPNELSHILSLSAPTRTFHILRNHLFNVLHIYSYLLHYYSGAHTCIVYGRAPREKIIIAAAFSPLQFREKRAPRASSVFMRVYARSSAAAREHNPFCGSFCNSLAARTALPRPFMTTAASCSSERERERERERGAYSTLRAQRRVLVLGSIMPLPSIYLKPYTRIPEIHMLATQRYRGAAAAAAWRKNFAPLHGSTRFASCCCVNCCYCRYLYCASCGTGPDNTTAPDDGTN